MPRTAFRGVTQVGKVRRRWKAEDAGVVLARLESSGLSVRAFAARENLNAQRLYRWRGQLQAPAPKAPPFIEIKPSPTTIEVVLRSGCVIRLPDGFSEVSLRRLVSVLEEPGT